MWQADKGHMKEDFGAFKRQAMKQEHQYYDKLNQHGKKKIQIQSGVPLTQINNRPKDQVRFIQEDQRPIQIGQTDVAAERQMQDFLREKKLSRAQAEEYRKDAEQNYFAARAEYYRKAMD